MHRFHVVTSGSAHSVLQIVINCIVLGNVFLSKLDEWQRDGILFYHITFILNDSIFIFQCRYGRI